MGHINQNNIMAEVIKMPRLSDIVEEGDILAEIETDKATMEFESFYEGTLLHIGVEEGEGAPVDALLAIIGEEGEDISDLIEGKGEDKSEDKKEKEEKEE